MPLYVNKYKHCEVSWTDTWDSGCDTECPICHKDIEPYSSVCIEAFSQEDNVTYTEGEMMCFGYVISSSEDEVKVIQPIEGGGMPSWREIEGALKGDGSSELKIKSLKPELLELNW